MIIYSITYQVDESTVETWLSWMKDTHIVRVMGSNSFFRYTFQELIEPEHLPGVRSFNLQYYAHAMAHLHRYWEEDEQILEGALAEKFGESVQSFDTVMHRLPQPVG